MASAGCNAPAPVPVAAPQMASSPSVPPAAAPNAFASPCDANICVADHYRTAKQLMARLVGRWAICSREGPPSAGFEYTADGKWYALDHRAGAGWERRTGGRAEDEAGELKIARDRRPPFVALDDDAQVADDFFVMTNIGRPMALFAFETAPRRMTSISYSHVARLVPIDP
jgi:hypothetical protein